MSERGWRAAVEALLRLDSSARGQGIDGSGHRPLNLCRIWFYAISLERKVNHPSVKAMADVARENSFVLARLVGNRVRQAQQVDVVTLAEKADVRLGDVTEVTQK